MLLIVADRPKWRLGQKVTFVANHLALSRDHCNSLEPESVHLSDTNAP